VNGHVTGLLWRKSRSKPGKKGRSFVILPTAATGAQEGKISIQATQKDRKSPLRRLREDRVGKNLEPNLTVAVHATYVMGP